MHPITIYPNAKKVLFNIIVAYVFLIAAIYNLIYPHYSIKLRFLQNYPTLSLILNIIIATLLLLFIFINSKIFINNIPTLIIDEKGMLINKKRFIPWKHIVGVELYLSDLSRNPRLLFQGRPEKFLQIKVTENYYHQYSKTTYKTEPQHILIPERLLSIPTETLLATIEVFPANSPRENGKSQ